MINKNQYNPDHVSPPGETLLEVLQALNLTQADLARKTGHSVKTINEIIKGKAPITAETALQLEKVTGVPARFWNNREIHYREFKAREAERKKLSPYIAWLKNFPIKEMIKRGWIRKCESKIDQLRALLEYFKISEPEQWESIWSKSRDASYRKSMAYQANYYYLAVWIRQGEIEASKINCKPYDPNKFKEALRTIRNRKLGDVNDYLKKIIDICAEAGVAVVYVQELPKISTYGITRWLTKDKALIQLCLRGKTHDQLCFTFFHEAAHILKHEKSRLFIETEGKQDKDNKEDEANKFAENMLIPFERWQSFIKQNRFTENNIKALAEQLNIHPGIIVGRLQREGHIKYSQLNHMKLWLRWADE